MNSPKPKKVEVYVEQHQGHLYAWRKSDHRFLGQGADKQALFERLAADVRGMVVYVCDVNDGGDLLLDK
jgi:hypothetical protein